MDSFYSRLVETHAIRVFGMEHQLRKWHEELGEALQAVNKYLNGEDSIEHLAEELADLSVTTEEMVLGFGVEQQFETFRYAKLDRLWATILEREGVTNRADETDHAAGDRGGNEETP